MPRPKRRYLKITFLAFASSIGIHLGAAPTTFARNFQTNAQGQVPRDSDRESGDPKEPDVAEGATVGGPQESAATENQAAVTKHDPPTLEEIIASLQPIPRLEEILAPLPGEQTAPPLPTLPRDDQLRVEELAAEITRLRGLAKYTEAVHAAENILEIRKRIQGDAWWETADADRDMTTLKGISALPEERQRELARADAADPEMEGLYVKGQYKQAIELVRSQLAIRRRLLGDDHQEVAITLNNLAVLLETTGDYAEAEALQRQVLIARRAILGDVHPLVAETVNDLAISCYRTGRYQAADSLYRKSLAMRRRLRGHDHSEVADSYNNLAVLRQVQGQYTTAEKLHREALAIRRRIHGAEHHAVAESLDNLALVLHLEGNYAEAESLGREALVMRRRLLGDTHPWVGISLNNLAGLMQSKGDLAAAERLFREALAVWRTVYPNPHPNIATALNNLAIVLKEQARYVEAEPLYREALALRRTLLGEDHPEVAAGFTNLAMLLIEKGDYDAAIPLHHRAISLYRKAYGDEHPALASALANLVETLYLMEDYAEAESLSLQALAMRRQLLGDAHPHVAQSLNDRAMILHAQGKYDAAVRMFQEVVTRCRDAGGDDHPDLGAVLTNLAAAVAAQGDYATAVAYFRQARRIYRSVYDDEHPYVVANLTRTAMAMADHGDDAEAEPLFAEALRIAERQRPDIIGTEGVRAAFAGALSLPQISKSFADLLLRQGRCDEALEVLERGRGRAVLDLLARSDRDLVVALQSVGDRSLSESLDRALEIEASARVALHTSEAELNATQKRGDLSPDEIRSTVARQQKKIGESRSQLRNAEAGVLAVLHQVWPEARPATSRQIQAALEDGDLLLAFNWTRRAVSVLVAHPAGELPLEGVVLARGRADVKKLSRWAKRVRQAIEDRPSPHFDQSIFREPARELFERLIPRQIRDRVLTAKRLIIVPDGPLWDVPLEALVIVPGALGQPGAGKKPFRLDGGPQVVYAESATVYLDRRQRRRQQLKSVLGGHLSALILGDPVFNQSWPPSPDQNAYVTAVADDSNAFRAGIRRGDILLGYDDPTLRNEGKLAYWRDGDVHTINIPPGELGVEVRAALPSEYAELAAVAPRGVEDKCAMVSALDQLRLYGSRLRPLPYTQDEVNAIARRFRETDHQANVTVLTGENARIDRLEADVAGKRFVHLATHGLSGSGHRPYDAGIALTRPEVPTADDIGFLTLDRLIRNWRGKLDGCELVVLSACDTLRGVPKGDSVISLPWGFMYAGAPTVVASLWQVDDVATTLLMERFYQNLLGGGDASPAAAQRGDQPNRPMSKAQALHDAKVWLRSLTPDQARHYVQHVGAKVPTEEKSRQPRGGKATSSLEEIESGTELDFSHPYFWAGFVLVGDPG